MKFCRQLLKIIFSYAWVLVVVACAETHKSQENGIMEQPQHAKEQPEDKPDSEKLESNSHELKQSLSVSRECRLLTQSDCLSSTQCLLEKTNKFQYICRQANNQCEEGFVQHENKGQLSCKNKRGCQFVPASCFCPEGVQCICGGGAPPMCLLPETSAS